MKSIIYTIILMVVSSQVFAVTDYFRTVGSVGTGISTNPILTGNFAVKEGYSTDCQFGIVYFDVTTNVGKSIYSTVLTAKASGKKLSRIEYNQNGPGQMCFLNYVEIES